MRNTCDLKRRSNTMFAWVLCTRKEKKEGRRDATWRVAYTTRRDQSSYDRNEPLKLRTVLIIDHYVFADALMPSAEEDHDHDLPCYTRRRSDYHHRWIFWAVNAAPRQIRRSCRRVRHRETSATSESRQIGPKQHWTPRPFQVARSSSTGTSPLSTATATATRVARSRCCRQAFCPRVPLLVLRIVAVFCLLLRLRVNVYASNLFVTRKQERRGRGAKKGRRHELRTRTETRKAIADRTKNRRRRCLFARSSFVALASPSLTESPSSLVSFRFHALPSTDSMRG